MKMFFTPYEVSRMKHLRKYSSQVGYLKNVKHGEERISGQSIEGCGRQVNA